VSADTGTSAAELDEALRHLARTARSAGTLLGLDFDGVLAPLQDDPDASRPLPAATAALLRLARTPGMHLAFVSGRALADLADRSAPPPGTLLVGSHGAERGRWADGQLTRASLALDPAAASLLDDVARELATVVRGSSGRVERKPASAVLHTRTATNADAARLTSAALAIGTRPGIDVLHGKDVVELSVHSVTKGDALAALRAELDVGALAYAGDDFTDERAFATLGPQDVTIKVGSGPTTARFRVARPADLAALLERLADLSA
jgi:trehalose-phosphatase